jgi:uncharacterized membrane protein
MVSLLVESAFILPCFGAAYALSTFVDRLSRRHMSHFVRGIFVFVAGTGFLATAAVVSLVIVCKFSSCDL